MSNVIPIRAYIKPPTVSGVRLVGAWLSVRVARHIERMERGLRRVVALSALR